MQPAFFDDGQLLAKTHYHLDACLWAQDTFIAGATFLMPSKVPEAGLESYSVDLDETTGIHHVFLRKASLRTSLALTKSSQPDYTSHVVEFSNGKMTAVPRAHCATTSLERGVQKNQCREHQWGIPIAQSEPVHPQYAESQPILANSTAPTPQKTISHNTTSPAISDSSITEFGRVVRQQAADDQSSLGAFSKSISHIVPWISTVSTCTTAKDSDATARAHGTQTPETYSMSRRSSAGSQDSRTPPSTAPTSPTFSTFSTMSFEKLVLANLPEVPTALGKVTYMVEALALEKVKQNELEKDSDSDRAVLRRHSLDLSFSPRQLNHLDKIQNSESPCLQEVSVLKIGLAMTEDGQIVMAEDASSNARSSPSLPRHPISVR